MKFVLFVPVALMVTLLLGTSSARTCVENARCPTGYDGYLLPHYYACEKYFRCEGGLACEQNCPEGLHFNAYKRVCEEPTSACCDIYLPCNPTE